MRLWALLVLILLAGCGVDGPPVPPGEDNPTTISDPTEIFGGRYL
ncbi:MAG: argininosuccinate lyase [Rhodobacter sp.]|nr:argininosuccinate lyase [Rhodobacter sp.]